MVLGVAGHHMVHAAQHVEKELILNRGFVTIHPRVKVVDHAKEMRGILKNAPFSFVLVCIEGKNTRVCTNILEKYRVFSNKYRH